jgi:hypothetical protein
VLVGLGACGPAEPGDCLDQAPPSWREDGLITASGALAEGVESNLRILTINVGNGVVDAGHYSLRLAHQGYEEVIAAKIQALQPAIVGLQEVIPRGQCEAAAACPVVPDADGFCQAGAGYVCEPLTCTEVNERPDQARRLVGPNYSILCPGFTNGGISAVDCLAIHDDFGRVVDYHDDSLLPAGTDRPDWGADAPEQWSYWLPEGFSPCYYTEGDCRFKAKVCDAESSILWADIAVAPDYQTQIRVVHLHPTALGDRCREHQLARAFEAAAARWDRDDARTLMLGDWNTDPERLVLPPEELLYYAYVGPTRRLHEHDERDQHCARVKTSPRFGGQRAAAIDRVVSDFAVGFCQVYDDRPSSMHGTTLPKFDGGLRPSSLPDTRDCACCYPGTIADAVMDHAAVICDLVWPDAPFPQAPVELDHE